MNQLIQDLLSDLRYAFRQFRKSPGFTATALITLTLGIGISTAAFTLMYGMILRRLPVPHPEQLYRLGDYSSNYSGIGGILNSGGVFQEFSYNLYLDLKKSAPEFGQFAAVNANYSSFSMRQPNAEAKYLLGDYVSGNFFAALGISPYKGRLLGENDDVSEAPPAMVLSYNAWRREFGGNPSAVGSRVYIQTHPFVIVGVAPRGFFGDRINTDAPAFWMPLSSEPLLGAPGSNLKDDDTHWLYIFGRVRSNTDIPLLQSRLSGALQKWLATRPAYSNPEDKAKLPKQHVVITSAAGGISTWTTLDGSFQFDRGLRLLMMLSSLVLLIACANIANLFLVRTIGRRTNISVSMALGAPRGRIIRQMFTESLLLSFFGVVLGLGFAFFSTYIILRLTYPDSLDNPVHATPTLPVLAFALLVSAASGVLVAMASTHLSGRIQPEEVLRGLNHSSRGLSSLPLRALVTLQAALSILLLMGALLAARSLYNLGHQNFGIATKNRYVLQFDLNGAGYTPEQRPALYAKILSRFSALGGVTGVGLAGYSFIEGMNWYDCVGPQGRPKPDNFETCNTTSDTVTPRYLDILGVPILQGREFTDQDTASSPKVAIINQTFANKFFPNQDALGKRFISYINSQPGAPDVYEVVGVFKDFKTFTPLLPVWPVNLRPIIQRRGGGAGFAESILIRFNREPEDVDGIFRRTLAKIDPNLTVTDVRSLDSQISETLGQQKLIARLAVVFAILALTLAAVGLYGVTAYTVAQRTGEIGIRTALGSTRFGIIRLVLRGVLLYTGLGLLIGIPCALGAGYLIRDQLYELHWYDPASLISAVLMLSTCALAAGLIPAYRAASIQPMQALRVE